MRIKLGIALLLLALAIVNGCAKKEEPLKVNSPPETPNAPLPGLPPHPHVGYIFYWGKSGTVRVKSTDPDGDDIRYYVSWGDKSSTTCTKYYASGETVDVTHIYYVSDGYRYIRARAEDIHGASSDWSASTRVWVEK